MERKARRHNEKGGCVGLNERFRHRVRRYRATPSEAEHETRRKILRIIVGSLIGRAHFRRRIDSRASRGLLRVRSAILSRGSRSIGDISGDATLFALVPATLLLSQIRPLTAARSRRRHRGEQSQLRGRGARAGCSKRRFKRTR